MRVLVAGATGAIGKPLIGFLNDGGHEVFALTRRADRVASMEAMGAKAIVADAMDREALLRALDGHHADAVIHQLTALTKTPARHRDMAMTNALRTTGTTHLLDAARAVGASRFVTQSMIPGYGYVDHGSTRLTEDAPFGEPHGSRSDEVAAAMRSTEQQAFEAEGIDGIALRYGCLYGPGPASDGVITMLRKRRVPLVKGGGGTIGWVFINDAAAATVAALERGRDGQAYNIVDDEPISWGVYMRALAQAVGAPPPRQVPAWLLRLMAPYFADLMVDTSMRVSNAKAKDELGWAPSMATYRDGFVTLGTT